MVFISHIPPRIAPDLPPKNLKIQNPQVIIFPIFPIHPNCGCFRFSTEVLCGRLLAAREDHLGVETDALCVRFRTKRWPYSWSSKVVEKQYLTGVYGRYIIHHDISWYSNTIHSHLEATSDTVPNYPCLGEGSDLLVCWVLPEKPWDFGSWDSTKMAYVPLSGDMLIKGKPVNRFGKFSFASWVGSAW